MASCNKFDNTLMLLAIVYFISIQCLAHKNNHIHGESDDYLISNISINVAKTRHRIPSNFFGIFFEEINHAGAGGLWSELVSNTGFEAGGLHTPSLISPWGVMGDEMAISIVTERSSCFQKNPIALRMDIHCDPTTCPPGGVGVYNPGYWGMNIQEGKSYKIVFHVKSSGPLDCVISMVNEDGTQVLAFQRITTDAKRVEDWTRMQLTLQARASYPRSRLQITTTQNGTIWLDQVSAMPIDTYKGHGYRTDLIEMLLDLKPRFLRFPGGCYVEGYFVRNAFRWKETVGPWEERPGHLGDYWNYWSDDGLGYLEYLQLAEDLGAEPVWVFNNGMGMKDEVDDPYLLAPFVQEMLDSVEFARGSLNSTWGSLRAKLGHPKPFSLKYVAIGNENCGKKNYKDNYLKFHKALKNHYPDIKIISTCDASKKPLDHPADLYDFHNYTTALGMLQLTHVFTKMRRNGPNAPKAFVSEYAVTKPEERVRNGSFEAALAEAAFLLSLEENSDIVEMVSYAPLFANQNDRTWNPDALFFNTEKVYGISSYWVQTFFKESSGANLLGVDFLDHTKQKNIYVTAIRWNSKSKKMNYVKIKVVNYNKLPLVLNIVIDGIDPKSIKLWRKIVLVPNDGELGSDNSFDNPTKVVPVTTLLEREIAKDVKIVIEPYSLTALDFILI